MFSANLYSKLSQEERSILDSYTERVAACQSKLKGLQEPEYRSFDEGNHPKKVLSTYILSEEVEEEERRPQSELRHEPPEREERGNRVSSAKDLGKAALNLSKHSSTSSKRASHNPTPKRLSRDPSPKRPTREITPKRPSRDSSPKHSIPSRPHTAPKSPANPRSLNLRVIPDLEGEVEKLLKVVHRFAKENAEMTAALEGGCKLYAQYSRAMAMVGKRKKKPDRQK